MSPEDGQRGPESPLGLTDPKLDLNKLIVTFATLGSNILLSMLARKLFKWFN